MLIIVVTINNRTMESNKQACPCHNLGNKENPLQHMCVLKVPTEFSVMYSPGYHCLNAIIIDRDARKETDPFVNRNIKFNCSVVRKISLSSQEALTNFQIMSIVSSASLSNHRQKTKLESKRKEKERNYYINLLSTYHGSDIMQSLFSHFNLQTTLSAMHQDHNGNTICLHSTHLQIRRLRPRHIQ